MPTHILRITALCVLVAAGAGCRSASPVAGTAPATPSSPAAGSPGLIQPGAPGQDGRPMSVADSTDLSKVQFTPADVKFMQGMIGHHQQAIEMAALLPTRTSRDDMKLLAKRIEVSQLDEIQMMQVWLKSRGQALPDPHAHHQHGAALMPGMLSPEQMAQLTAAKGVQFDRLFLEGMIRHHARRADDGAGAVRDARRGPGQRYFRVRVGRRSRSADGDRSDGCVAEGAAEMKSVTTRVWTVAALLGGVVLVGAAQQAPADPKDPRIGLKPGLRDAGTAARNMELTATMPRPEGFFNPKQPAGEPSGPETAATRPRMASRPRGPAAARRHIERSSHARGGRGSRRQARHAAASGGGGLDFANSDMAFAGTHMWVGNFHGFNTYDVENPQEAAADRLGGLPRRPG